MEAQGVRVKVNNSDQIQLRLEWTRRSVAAYITEINNIQVYVESKIDKIKEELKLIENFESKLVKAKYDPSGRQGEVVIPQASTDSATEPGPNKTPIPTFDDNAYTCLYLAKLYADLALFVENEIYDPCYDADDNTDTLSSNRTTLLKPIFGIVVQNAVLYLKVASVTYDNRFATPDILQLDEIEGDIEECQEEIEILKTLLEDNLTRFKSKYEEKHAHTPNGKLERNLSDESSSSLDSLCTDPSSGDHIVPLYFKVFVHENKDRYWKYLSPTNRALMVESAGHLPPSKLLTLTLKVINSDIIDLAEPKRQIGKGHDLILENAQMSGLCDSPPTQSDVYKIMALYSQFPIKAFLSQCKLHVNHKVKLLKLKFACQCKCERMFHFCLIKINS